MKFRLDTFYKNQDEHGNSIACLECVLETANIELRNRVDNAIRAAINSPEPEPESKMSAIGFETSHAEEE